MDNRTVKELREFLEDIPDDFTVLAYEHEDGLDIQASDVDDNRAFWFSTEDRVKDRREGVDPQEALAVGKFDDLARKQGLSRAQLFSDGGLGEAKGSEPYYHYAFGPIED